MQHIETIIIGGGPAGSSCAWQLKRNGRDVLILDKAQFPRHKLCAGWITAKVLSDLEFSAADYRHSILDATIHTHIRYIPFTLHGSPNGTSNYSIRRFEFDEWLLQRSKAPVIQHEVKSIRSDGDNYIIDDQYSCRNLVGAGGTSCPVARLMFADNRQKFRQVVTLEQEFRYPARNPNCHLYFGHYGIKGYAWYFPKGDGYLNIGIGGKANYFKSTGISIHQHLDHFLCDLVEQEYLDAKTAASFQKSGHPYYLNSDHGKVKKNRCFLIGDAAGLATCDLGEGIGPAIESALLTADEILGTACYSKQKVTKYSTTGLVGYLARKLVAPKPGGDNCANQ